MYKLSEALDAGMWNRYFLLATTVFYTAAWDINIIFILSLFQHILGEWEPSLPLNQHTVKLQHISCLCAVRAFISHFLPVLWLCSKYKQFFCAYCAVYTVYGPLWYVNQCLMCNKNHTRHILHTKQCLLQKMLFSLNIRDVKTQGWYLFNLGLNLNFIYFQVSIGILFLNGTTWPWSNDGHGKETRLLPSSKNCICYKTFGPLIWWKIILVTLVI